MFVKDPRLTRLALKYTYIWKTRCTALRAKACGDAHSDRCSVRCVIIRASDGSLQILRREHLHRLKVGSEPYGKGRIRARIRQVPAQLPPDLFFVPMDISLHSGADASDFASLLFTGPTRVYLLLPTLMREPRWLRDLFVRVRDPASGNPLGLTASWHFGSGVALLLASGMKYQAFVKQRLMVWESVRVYDADEELVLGGPGHAEMGDTVFVIAARSLSPAPAPSATPNARGTGPPPLQHSPDPFVRRHGSRLSIVTSGCSGGGGGGISEAYPVYTSAPAAAASSRRESSRGIDAVQGSLYTAADSFMMNGAAHPDSERRPAHVSFGRPNDGVWSPAEGGGGGSAVPLSGSAWLLQRFIKAVKRDRVQDLRALLNSEAWQRYCMSPLDVSFLPPGERHPLVVDLAVANRSLPLLVELVDRAGCHLDYRSLKFLVGSWDRLPEHCAGGGEGLLLRYLVRQPNPLSVVGACLLAMRAELTSEGRHHSAALQHAVPRFQAVQMALLEQLQDSYFRTSEDVRREAGLPLLENILEQPQVILAGGSSNSGAGGGGGGSNGGGGSSSSSSPAPPLVLSDYSPLRLAFRDHDTLFMSAPLIKAYTQRRWLGPEYTALTCLDGHHRLSGLDSLLVYTLVENLGFVGDTATGSMQATFRLWHLVTMTSPAFFRSPRGRWAMKLMSTIAYLTLYMIVLLEYDKVWLPDSEGGRIWRAVQAAFLVFTAGNVLEGLEVMTMRYRNSAGRYFMAAPGEVLGVLVDVGAFAAVAPSVVVAYLDVAHFCTGGNYDYGGGAAATAAAPAAADGGSSRRSLLHLTSGSGGVQHPSCLSDSQWMALRLALATLGIFVYLRSLVVLVPLYRKLGPLIRTMTRMGGEVLAFVPLYVSVTLGFAAALSSTIGDEVLVYHRFPGAVLQLFEATLGTFNYDEFANLDEQQRLYAYLLLSIYLVLSALLLMNLLIAIISYKYRPEEVKADSAFDQAELVDRYRFQAQHHLICSPFNLLLLAFAWLPAMDLPKLPPYEWVKYGLTPLDGLTFATPLHLTTPGGRHELPHLCYLLTLYPLIIAAANVLYYIHAPYAVLYWAFTGHRKLLRELLGGNGTAAAAATTDGSGGAAAAAVTATAARPSNWVQNDIPTRLSGGVSSRVGKDGLTGLSFGFGGGTSMDLGLHATASPSTPAPTLTPTPDPTTQQWPQRCSPHPGAVVRGTDADAGPAQGSAGGVGQSSVAAREPPPCTGAAGGDAGAASARSGGGGGGRKCGGVNGGWVSVRFTAPEGKNDSSVGDVDDEDEGGGGGGGGRGGGRSGPVAEGLRLPTLSGDGDGRDSGGGGGSKRESLEHLAPQPSSGYRMSTAGGGSGGGGNGGGGPMGLRARSLRSMYSYANSQEVGVGNSNRNLSARLAEASLYEDTYDSAVEPPYMSLLRLATLRGASGAVLSAGRFAVLVVVGAVLYVIVMGLLAGTLGCCLVVWTGSVAVSIGRIIVGAWRGARGDGNGDGVDGGGGCPGGTATSASGRIGRRNGGDDGGRKDGAAATAAAAATSPSSRLVFVSRLARRRANRSNYLTRDQVEAAVRNVYAAADVLATGAAAGGGGGGVAAGVSAGWNTVTNSIYRNPALGAASAFASRTSGVLRTVLPDCGPMARADMTAAATFDAAPSAAVQGARVDADTAAALMTATAAAARSTEARSAEARSAEATVSPLQASVPLATASPRAASSLLSPPTLMDLAQDLYDEGHSDAGTSFPEPGGGEMKSALLPMPRLLTPPRSAASGIRFAAAAAATATAAAAAAPATGAQQAMPAAADGLVAISKFGDTGQDVRRSREAAADAFAVDGGGGGRDTPTNSRLRLAAACGDRSAGGAADHNAAVAANTNMYDRGGARIPGAIASVSGPPPSGPTSGQLSDALAQLAELTVIVRQLTVHTTEKPVSGIGGA